MDRARRLLPNASADLPLGSRMNEHSFWMNGTVLLTLWAIGIVTPPLALLAVIVLGRTSPSWRRPAATAGATSLAVVAIAIFAKVNFTVPAANVAALFIIYAVYCFLACASLWLRRPLVKFPLVALASLPILGTYFALTVGSLALMFTYGDMMSPPEQVQKMDPGLTCRTTLWGSAISDDGYTVHLYQTPAWAPFLQRELRTIVVDETDPGGGTASADCEDTIKPPPKPRTAPRSPPAR